MDLSNEQNLDQPISGSRLADSTSWITNSFLLFLGIGFAAISVILFQEGKQEAVFIALIAAAALWLLEVLENLHRTDPRPVSTAVPGSFVAIGVIAFVACIACLPTLHIYFLTDDFALVHSFHSLSSAEFLRLLHMDTRQFVSGDARQEFRPLYSLFYLSAYQLWGLRLWGYHFCGILFHVLVSVLVFLIAKTLAPGNLRSAGFAGVLFAVQPAHAQALSLIVGTVAECLPAVLYLSAFLFFIRFRFSGRLRSLVISIVAFTAGLLTKESAVTLPLMLFSFDLFRIITGETAHALPGESGRWVRWRNFLLPYVPYAILLFLYLAWRRRVLTSYLRESNWANRAPEVAASPQGFWLHASHFVSHLWQLQVFNFQSLFPYSAPILGLVLGVFLVWAVLLFRSRQHSLRTVARVLYFGLVWYSITNLPYLIEGHVPYHLYLPIAGLCICVGYLALPTSDIYGKTGKYSHLLAMAFLVIVSVTQMWNGEAEYVRLGGMSERMTGELAISLSNIPREDLVVLWPGSSPLIASGWGEGIVPFAVQPPFTTTDLSANIRIIEHPEMSCCGVGEWWYKIGPLLSVQMTRPRDEEVVVHLLSWNDSTATFALTTRTMQRQLLVDRVTASLGSSPALVDSVDDADATKLAKALADLIVESGELPQRKR